MIHAERLQLHVQQIHIALHALLMMMIFAYRAKREHNKQFNIPAPAIMSEQLIPLTTHAEQQLQFAQRTHIVQPVLQMMMIIVYLAKMDQLFQAQLAPAIRI